MRTLLASLTLVAGLAFASPALAQLPPGPSLVNGNCLPSNTFNPTPACIITVLIPNNPDFDCVFFTNIKTFTTIDLPVDPFLNPSGADCVPAQSAGPTIQVRMSRPALTKGSIFYVATAALKPPSPAPMTRSSGTGEIADVSFCRGFNLAVCPLEALGIPIPGCPAICNDVSPGEFPDPFPGQ